MALTKLLKNSTFFLFHLSTRTPAKTPNKSEGKIKARATPDTAVLELATVKTTIRSVKERRFIATCEKNSEAKRKAKEGIARTLKKGFFIYICYQFSVVGCQN